MKNPFLLGLRHLILALLIAAALPVSANDHGGGGGGAAGLAPMKFTVNIGPGESLKYLQVEMVFECATPEAGQQLTTLAPKVKHRMILLLSSADANLLKTTPGKHDLQEQIVKNLNELLDETPKTGVSEVLFTSFIIQ